MFAGEVEVARAAWMEVHGHAAYTVGVGPAWACHDDQNAGNGLGADSDQLVPTVDDVEVVVVGEVLRNHACMGLNDPKGQEEVT